MPPNRGSQSQVREKTPGSPVTATLSDGMQTIVRAVIRVVPREQPLVPVGMMRFFVFYKPEEDTYETFDCTTNPQHV